VQELINNKDLLEKEFPEMDKSFLNNKIMMSSLPQLKNHPKMKYQNMEYKPLDTPNIK